MNIGSKLNFIRENKKISVYKLSKLTDISENHIHNIEKCITQPSVLILEKLLSALGTNLSEFFNENDNVVSLNKFETELIQNIRLLDDEKSDAILKIIKLMNNK